MIKKIRNFLWLSVFLPSLAFAQNPILNSTPNFGLPTGIGTDSSGTLKGSIAGIISLVLSVVGLIAVGFLIYGGFRYITSGGNNEVVGQAKKTITNAIIGLVIVILSYVIVRVVTNAVFRQY